MKHEYHGNEFGKYTTYELKEMLDQENPMVIVPIGAYEQHGQHLPINTDADLGYQVALELVSKSKLKGLVLPSIWAGFSSHHMDFTGTITVKQSTLFHYVFDVIESLIHHGFNRIILMNSHGGNTHLLKTVSDEISLVHKLPIYYFNYWRLISDSISSIRKSESGGMGHAGEFETSLKYYFNEKNKDNEVRKNLIKDEVIPDKNQFSVDLFASNKYQFYRRFTQITKSGTIGKPSVANSETGEKIMKELVKEFSSITENFCNNWE